jgi:hypothetical protein
MAQCQQTGSKQEGTKWNKNGLKFAPTLANGPTFAIQTACDRATYFPAAFPRVCLKSWCAGKFLSRSAVCRRAVRFRKISLHLMNSSLAEGTKLQLRVAFQLKGCILFGDGKNRIPVFDW